MEINSIRLKNFRQFYGDQEIALSGSGEKNVTLIHAENGVGKTTLLNSVLWCFFGRTTEKFEQKFNIVNFEAEAEGDNSASVEISFQHEGKAFLATRTYTTTQGGHRKEKFAVMIRGSNGALSEPLDFPESFINTVIPVAMAPYFFFDGEQAETFGSESNNRAIASAIRDILGSNLIENGIKDLEYVARKFNEELGENSGDEQIRAIEEKITRIEEARAERELRLEALSADIGAYQDQLRQISAQLLQAKEAETFQREREEKKRQKDTTTLQITEAKTEILRWISSKAISLVSTSLTSQSMDFIDEESLKNRIPSPYNEDFVQGLLKAQECICKRPLAPSTQEWRSVASLLESAANAEVLSRVVKARSRINVLRETQDDAASLLKSLEERLARLVNELAELEQSLADLNKKIAGLPVAEIQERERARIDLDKKCEAAKEERTRAIRDNELAEDEIRRLNKEVSDLALKNVAAQDLVTRRDLAYRAAEVLRGVLESNEQEARKEIEAAVNSVLENIARRYYRFEIDETFDIKLLYSDGRAAPKSGGENQMMSLAFIAALVQYAKRRSSEPDDGLFIPATVAPLVLDSPFGQLDKKYREGTARFVPEMAPQVVLLVSTSQGDSIVLDALRSRVGEEYVLVAKNKESIGRKSKDVLHLDGQDIETTLFSAERNMTEIRRVTR